MSRRKQQRNNYSESDSSSDDDDAPEEVSTSNWGKETFLSKKQSEQNAKDEIKRIATERRKAIADKIRKRQEESKKQKALKLKQEEEERQRRIANGEEEEEDDEDDEYEYNNNNNNNNRRDDDNNNNVNHKDVHDTQQTVMHIDNNNDVTRDTYRNNAIERGINRILNNQQNMNEAIGRINNTRQSIQSYLHNVYSNNNTNNDDQRRLRRHLNLQNALRLSNSSFANMSTWNVKYSEKEYSDCAICLEKMACKQKVVSVHGTHIFHHQCIKRWFERSSLCPLCKRDCETKASSTYYAKK